MKEFIAETLRIIEETAKANSNGTMASRIQAIGLIISSMDKVLGVNQMVSHMWDNGRIIQLRERESIRLRKIITMKETLLLS